MPEYDLGLVDHQPPRCHQLSRHPDIPASIQLKEHLTPKALALRVALPVALLFRVVARAKRFLPTLGDPTYLIAKRMGWAWRWASIRRRVLRQRYDTRPLML
jgi:hypothetical protein